MEAFKISYSMLPAVLTASEKKWICRPREIKWT